MPQVEMLFRWAHLLKKFRPPSMDKAEIPPDEAYHSESDEDFNPEVAAATTAASDAESSSSDEGDAAATHKPRKRRRTNQDGREAEDLGFDNSGDEATIQKGRRKKHKGGAKAGGEDFDDEGGEGGSVKTRAQRRAEVHEKKPLTQASKASVDVNQLWAQMASPDPAQSPQTTQASDGRAGLGSQQESRQGPLGAEAVTEHQGTGATDSMTATSSETPKEPANGHSTPMITIKRKYDFAGQTMEEEKQVPADSAEARLYLQAQQDQQGLGSSGAPKPGLRKPMKKKSIFGASESEAKAKKLTTLEKSKLDWASHVDKEGIGEELDEHSKAKNAYLGRMDFLGRMDAKREQELSSKKTS